MQKKVYDCYGKVVLYFLTWSYWDLSLEFPQATSSPSLVLDYSFYRKGKGYATYKVVFANPSQVHLGEEETLSRIIYSESHGIPYE